MKLIQVTASALFCFVSVIAAPSKSNALHQRAADSVPSYLGHPATFYRAITRGLVKTVAEDYVVGQSPKTGTKDPGDFVPSDKSGLHVFANPLETKYYGECYASIAKAPSYLVTMSYTPDRSLKVKSFTTPNEEWLFYVSRTPHDFDIVEGPYSGARGKAGMEQITPGGNMLWQGAFVGPKALSTLKVTKVEKVNPPGKVDRKCCELIPGCVVS